MRTFFTFIATVVIAITAHADPKSMLVKDYEDFMAELNAKKDRHLEQMFETEEQEIKELAEPYELRTKVTVRVIVPQYREIKGYLYDIRLNSNPPIVRVGNQRINYNDIYKVDQERLLHASTGVNLDLILQRKRDELNHRKANAGRIFENEQRIKSGYTQGFLDKTIQLGGYFHYRKDLGHETIKLQITVNNLESDQLVRCELINQSEKPSNYILLQRRGKTTRAVATNIPEDFNNTFTDISWERSGFFLFKKDIGETPEQVRRNVVGRTFLNLMRKNYGTWLLVANPTLAETGPSQPGSTTRCNECFGSGKVKPYDGNEEAVEVAPVPEVLPVAEAPQAPVLTEDVSNALDAALRGGNTPAATTAAADDAPSLNDAGALDPGFIVPEFGMPEEPKAATPKQDIDVEGTLEQIKGSVKVAKAIIRQDPCLSCNGRGRVATSSHQTTTLTFGMTLVENPQYMKDYDRDLATAFIEQSRKVMEVHEQLEAFIADAKAEAREASIGKQAEIEAERERERIAEQKRLQQQLLIEEIDRINSFVTGVVAEQRNYDRFKNPKSSGISHDNPSYPSTVTMNDKEMPVAGITTVVANGVVKGVEQGSTKIYLSSYRLIKVMDGLDVRYFVQPILMAETSGTGESQISVAIKVFFNDGTETEKTFSFFTNPGITTLISAIPMDFAKAKSGVREMVISSGDAEF